MPHLSAGLSRGRGIVGRRGRVPFRDGPPRNFSLHCNRPLPFPAVTFLRQNPGFVGVLAIGFLVGTLLLFLWRGSVEEAERAEGEAERARARLEAVLAGSLLGEGEAAIRVTPTREHRVFLEERVAQLRITLQDLRDRLRVRDPTWLADPADELSFLPKVREFVEAQRAAAEKAGTAVAPDEAFGFAAFATAAATPPPDQLPLLDRQRQVLAYLLAQLLAASPTRIVAVQREAVGIGAQGDRSAGSRGSGADTFVRTAWPGRGEEVPGDTLFFRVVFEGKTATLRTFLEELARFALPVVVRSVEVAPVTGPADSRGNGPAEAPAPPSSAATPAWDTLFGGSPPAAPEEPGGRGAHAPAPLLADNESRFTVLLLWIEEGSLGTAGGSSPEEPS
mgnify:CR=1 FL=1